MVSTYRVVCGFDTVRAAGYTQSNLPCHSFPIVGNDDASSASAAPVNSGVLLTSGRALRPLSIDFSIHQPYCMHMSDLSSWQEIAPFTLHTHSVVCSFFSLSPRPKNHHVSLESCYGRNYVYTGMMYEYLR